jgi:hypothetical protein
VFDTDADGDDDGVFDTDDDGDVDGVLDGDDDGVADTEEEDRTSLCSLASTRQ